MSFEENGLRLEGAGHRVVLDGRERLTVSGVAGVARI